MPTGMLDVLMKLSNHGKDEYMGNLTRRQFAQFAGTGALALSFGSMLAACTGGSSNTGSGSGSAQQSQVIVSMTTSSEPAAGFDPLVSWGCGEHVHEPLIQSTLITTDRDLSFVNDLATAYECSADGMTWTFSIRDDARFSDGHPLTARDVAFTINGINASPAAEADLSMVSQAEAIDDVTVVLHMAKPNNALLYTLAVVGIVPEHAYDENYGSHPIGSGRYVLEQWDRGQQVILTANPDYYGEAPKMQRVVVVFMGEDASLAGAQSGQVDVAYTSAVYADRVPRDYSLLQCATVDSRGISLPTIGSGSTRADGLNTYPAGNDVTSDLALRRAINCAVDREAMIEHVLNGYGKPAYSVSDGMPWSSDDMKAETDVPRAKEMLDEAGWSAASDGIRVKNGTRASFDVWYPSSDSVRQALAAEFANQMKSVGIEVNIKGASWDDIYPHEFSSPILWGWGSNSPVEVYELNYSKGWGNYACYENATVDANLDAAIAQTDVANSYEYWKKAQWDGAQGVAPQGAATWVWLANVDHLYFQRAGLKVAQQKPHPHGHGWSLVNNVDQWEWA